MAFYIPVHLVIATTATETMYVTTPIKGKVKSFYGNANTTMSSGKTITLYASDDTSAMMTATYTNTTSAAGTVVTATDQSLADSQYTFTAKDTMKVVCSSATTAGDFYGWVVYDEYNL